MVYDMPWVGDRHGLPWRRAPPIAPVNVTRTSSIGLVNNTRAHMLPHVPGLGVDTGMLVYMILGLVALIVLYIVVRDYLGLPVTVLKQSIGLKQEKPGKKDRGIVSRKYYYSGLRLVIRRLYLLFINRLRSLGVALKDGYTPREIASKAFGKIGDLGYKIAYLYEKTMYSRLKPSLEDVGFFRKLVDSVGEK